MAYKAPGPRQDKGDAHTAWGDPNYRPDQDGQANNYRGVDIESEQSTPSNAYGRTPGKLDQPVADQTEWNTFDEQGVDHGGARSRDSVEGPTPDSHTERANLPSGAGPSS